MSCRAAIRRLGLLLLGLALAGTIFAVVGMPDSARAAAGFSPTGSLLTGRTDHTATRLPDGKVLVVGGRRSTGAIATAEIYDPATGKFTETTGGLNVARSRHGAALLPDGDVLIAGGFADESGTTFLPLERFSAATGTFGTVSDPRPALLFPSVTLLADGRVLIAGGYNGGTYFQTAAVFGPADNSLVDAANLLVDGRSRHTAVRLNSGEVLLVGGSGASGYFASAEIFNPTSLTFRAAGDSLDVARRHIAAALLDDGRVLLAGGEGAGPTDLATAEIYEPGNDRFVSAGTMPTGRSHSAAALLDDGRVLIAGGLTELANTASAVLYRPTGAAGSFATTGSLATARADHTATTLLDGRVLVVGGTDGTALASAEIYTPEIISGVTISPAAPSVISSVSENLVVGVVATGTTGTTDTITVKMTDATGGTQSNATTLTIGSNGSASGGVSFAVGALGVATITATDTSGTAIAPTSVLVKPTGFALTAPPGAFRSGEDTAIELTAQAAGGADASNYGGTPSLTSPASPADTFDPSFAGSCPQFSGATATCTVNFGDLGLRAFAATDGGATTFGPMAVLPAGFAFSAAYPNTAPVNFGALRSGAQFTLRATATAKAGASIAGYDGAAFSVALGSNDGTPLSRTANPVAGVATFANVGFVRLGGQSGSPFTPQFTATDNQLAASSASQPLVVGPSSLSLSPLSGSVRSGTEFTVSIVANASSGVPEDRDDFTGTVAVAAPGDPAATIPAAVNFTAGGGGATSFPATFRSLGAQSLVVTETGAGASASLTRAVTPLVLAFVSGPSTVPQAGTAEYSVAPIADSAGTVTGYAGLVTLSAGPGATVSEPATQPCAPSCTFTVSFTTAGSVTLNAADDSEPPATSPDVTVTVTPPSSLQVTPPTLAFNATVGGGTPAAQTLRIEHAGAAPLAWTATATTATGGSWLQLATTSGTTPTEVAVSVASGSLGAGTHLGTIIVSAPGAANGPQTVSVSLTVTSPSPPAPPPPPPPPAGPTTFTLTTAASPADAGQILVDPAMAVYPAGTMVALAPQPEPGQIFIGWMVDGSDAGWPVPLSITMNASHTVTARFAPRPGFSDLPRTHPNYEAIIELAARGIIRGYGDGRFGPDDTTLRAQMAALIARALGWDAEDHGNTFPDRGPVDADLWRNVGTLAFYRVARGYPDGRYRPTDPVLHAQTISFITRAMVAKGYWQPQPDKPALYPDVSDPTHRADLATYTSYAGAVPGTTSTTASWPKWNQPSTRGWFAQALWQALNAYSGFTPAP